ncbi:hypothetical protein LNY65_28720 [Klebsiella pneumoniae]|nr:hypothetical protein [Klebsiella pneumoniae]MCJ7034106.1 hypothetical protein [Klebsiella pneumoniae]
MNKTKGCLIANFATVPILKHLKQKTAKANAAKQRELPPERAPPLTPSLFDPSQSRLFD